jgi:hypothetical protein
MNALAQITDLLSALYPQLNASDKATLASDNFFSDWTLRWHQDLFQAKSGYPIDGHYRKTPDLENEFIAHVSKARGLADPRSKGRPTLCLTHDIDYLESTAQMRIKRLISQRKAPWKGVGDNYLKSIQTLLECDRAFADTSAAVSTVFVAAPLRSGGPLERAKQWLIDPSYSRDEKNLPGFQKLISKFPTEIGLHGSYLSLGHQTLAEEKKELKNLFPKARLKSNRQHWLNCSSATELSEIQKSGFLVDSSFGWNGGVGFRGGFSRPFPVRTTAGCVWELPLLLMDGPMFDDMKLQTAEVVRFSTELLHSIESLNPMVAIDWHDRAAHSDYGWFDAYEQILGWAKKRGWLLTSIEGAMKLHVES